MKKKFVVGIVVSSIGLLLGGLIYVGISSFPELLENEKAANNEEGHIKPVIKQTITIEESVNEEPSAIVIDNGTNYIPSTIESSPVLFLDAPKIIKETNASSKSIDKGHKDFSLVTDFIEGSASNSYTFETNNTGTQKVTCTSEHFSYSEETLKESAVLKTNAKKAKMKKNQSVRSNEALVETSLLVVGVVDIISMILINRKKHLLR